MKEALKKTKAASRLLATIADDKRNEILLTPIVKLVPKGSLPVSEGKAVRVVDKRTVYK